MLVLSWRLPVGLAGRRTSRKRRSTALGVRTLRRSFILRFVTQAGEQLVKVVS
jgi:hypothetical protein